MKKVSDLLHFFSEKAPWEHAEKWDNVGLLVGDPEAHVRGVLSAIELSPNLIRKAKESSANVLVVHHPIFFKGIKALRFEKQNVESNWVKELIQNDINLICLHTNFDRAPDGLHRMLFSELGFREETLKPLEKIISKDPLRLRSDSEALSDSGYGIYGELERAVPVCEFIDLVKQKFSLTNVRFTGDLQANISSAGFVSGSGVFLWQRARDLGLDIFITGDVKHHDALDAFYSGLNLLDVGHFGAEKHFATVIQQWLQPSGLSVEPHIDRDPFQFL